MKISDCLNFRNISLSVFLGGIAFIGASILSSHFQATENFLKLLAVLFFGIGGYFSLSIIKQWKLDFAISMLGILAVHVLYHLYFLKSIETSPQSGMIRLMVLQVIAGSAGAKLKYDILLAKLKPITKPSLREEYESLLNYRMNWAFRISGIISGIAFVLTPLLILSEFERARDETISFWIISVLIIMCILSVCLGLLFLAVCVSGKYPKYVIRKKLKELQRNGEDE